MTVAVATMTAEILRVSQCSPRSDAFLKALTQAAGAAQVDVSCTTQYRGRSDVLVLWGPGHPTRFEPMAQQRAAGRHVMACDLAYWSRGTKVRISIDAAHPQAWVMRRNWPASRWESDSMPVVDGWNPTGSVMVAGIGEKALTQYGPGVVDAWERQIIRECEERGWRVEYRAKKNGAIPAGVARARSGAIDEALLGHSLVCTWHSNVAVDAIRMGIPVVCRDGAAAAVCPSAVPEHPVPLDPAIRMQFLHNLAWFQYDCHPKDARACWTFVRELLAC